MKKEEEKLSKFPEMLSKMRRERGVSQKKAATDLGISQALLSHYEKGIRECGLDFVIKCSQYYGVTTDYLLGISDSRNGMSDDFLSSIQVNEGKSVKNLSHCTKFMLDMASALMTATGEKHSNYLYDYFLMVAYRGSLTLAKAGVLPKELFKIDYTIARDLASAAIALQDAKFVLIEDKSRTGIDEKPFEPLCKMINEAEEYILSNYVF